MNVNELKPHPSKMQAKNVTQVPTQERAKKVVNGQVKVKKNEIRKFTDIFVQEDINVVKDYIFNELVIPYTKNLIGDIFHNTVDMMLYGRNSGGRTKSTRRSDVGHVSYRDYYKDGRDSRRERSTYNSRFNYDDISFEYRADAEAVLEQMKDIIDTYDLVRVLDLYDLAGESPAPHTANNYGWTNLSRAYVDRTRDGYIIKLPKAVALD